MKNLFLVFVLVLLCASFADAYIYRNIGFGGSLRAITGSVVSDASGLGPVQFSLHPYTIDNREAGFAKPGTPLVAVLNLKKRGANSPPASDSDNVKILVSVINSAGGYDVFGYGVDGIAATNKFEYDAQRKVWFNDKFLANGNVNTRLSYVIFVEVDGEAKFLPFTLNVK